MVQITFTNVHEIRSLDNLGFDNPFHQPGVIHSDVFARFDIMDARSFVDVLRFPTSRDENAMAVQYLQSLESQERKRAILYHAEQFGMFNERNFYQG